MPVGEDNEDLAVMNQASQAAWDQNAAFWDAYHGEGGSFQRLLLGPASVRLLDVQPGWHMLDVACGNGAFARRLAALGATVTACDFSRAFLERARTRTSEHAGRIEYRLVDCTDEAQLLALGERSFDAGVCTMALMDMPAIDPLFRALARLLRPGAPFVFSVLHPCFNNTACTKVLEEVDRAGQMITTRAVKIAGYAHLAPARGLGIIGQPVPQIYFDRPLHALFNAAFRAGLVLDGLEEPLFGPEVAGKGPFDWANYHEIPPVLVARLRLPA